jgi:hypothetical protein
VGEQADLLDRVADVAAQLGRRAVAHAAPVEQDVARRQLDHAVDQPHRGRLAAARGSDEDADVPSRHEERQAADRRLAGARVDLRDLAELQRGRLRVRRRPLGVGGVRAVQEEAPRAERAGGS